ncbi:MAG: 50S ribosomal protein L6 [Clostridia bacterium]
MSRIGRSPIAVPAGVSVVVDANNLVSVSGAMGKLSQQVDKCITVSVADNVITLSRINDNNDVKAKHGLYRALVNNMVEGVSKGFSKSLVVKGVGYKLAKNGNKLTMNIGFSHPVVIEEAEGIKIEIPSPTDIKVSGIDKHLVGQVAAKIRDIKPIEPYHGYGIRYSDEVVVLKQGKSAGKGKK